ncbi:hypothetical protein [Streptomyces sp. NPDC056544]|uniref:hypothetical protein n=1 Tax=unclassified Streptomyces TaxID=2593676 RepID=UPI003687D3FE
MSVKTSILRAAGSATATATATCAVSLVLFAVPAHADEPVPTPSSASASASALAVRDKGGAGQGAPVAPSQAAAGPSITRSEVIKRAASWVGIGLQYSWNNTYQGYRTDCSGFASMAWRLGTPGLDTTSFVPAGVASWIGKSDLKPGDALLNDAAGANGHIVVFGGWVNSARTSYRGYEFTGSGMHYREIPYPYYSGYGTFRPVRNNSIVDDDSGDLPVSGNWDSGPASNVGIWRNGTFHLRNDDGSTTYVGWGVGSDLPVSANWDGAGPDNVGIFRPSTGQFHLRGDDGSLTLIDWGGGTDQPVAGNWDGGAAANVGIWRNGRFHLRNDDGSATYVDWGQAGDRAVSGNWDGVGPDNVGIFRPSTGQFHLRRDDGSLVVLDWGHSNDIPVAGNWDGGNGSPVANIGIWRPSQALFHLRNDDGTPTYVSWGQPS